MMELLIWAVDGGEHLQRPDGGRGGYGAGYEAGDVITCKPDGFDWPDRCLTDPAWRIVRVDLSQVHVEDLQKPETRLDVTKDGEVLETVTRKRSMRLAIDKFSAAEKTFMGDVTRAEKVKALSTEKPSEMVAAKATG